ncbi:MAG: hypothetical protein Q4C83_02570 [Candidatus Saccharibacteria bacterium]|nr:hypothetical protein [Candidatus Saccharibacteria bacterium]
MNYQLAVTAKTVPKSVLYSKEVSVLAGVIKEVIAISYPENSVRLAVHVFGQRNEAVLLPIMQVHVSPESNYDFGMLDSQAHMMLNAHQDEPIRGIHWRDNYMNITTTLGRFIVTAAASSTVELTSRLAMISFAQTLANIGLEDKILQESVAMMTNYFPPVSQLTARIVKDLFKSNELPCIKEWRQWHEPANSNDGLELFFG